MFYLNHHLKKISQVVLFRCNQMLTHFKVIWSCMKKNNLLLHILYSSGAEKQTFLHILTVDFSKKDYLNFVKTFNIVKY